METTRKIFDIIRVTAMTIVMELINVFGSLYILEDIMYDETWMMIFFWAWFIASTYKLVMMEICDIKRILKK